MGEKREEALDLGESQFKRTFFELYTTLLKIMFCSFFISDIKEEDLPIYVGSGAGILLLLFVLVGVASWRCTRPTAVSVQRASQNKEQGT